MLNKWKWTLISSYILVTIPFWHIQRLQLIFPMVNGNNRWNFLDHFQEQGGIFRITKALQWTSVAGSELENLALVRALGHLWLTGPPPPSLKANENQPLEMFCWERSNVPFKQLFSWPNRTSTLSSIAYNTHERKQIFLDTTFWPSSIWLFMLFQLFLVEKINMVSEKKKT